MEARDYLSQLERTRYDEFSGWHFANCLGLVKIHFSSGGGIGSTVTIKCTQCGEEENITDYSDW